MWETNLSKTTEDGTIIRGYPLEELVQNKSFSEVIFLLLQGELPDEKQARLMDAILVSTIDHGVCPPTGYVPRVIAGCGTPLPSAVAAGVLAIGDQHGGAIEQAAKLFAEQKDVTAVVKDALKNKKRLAGFGHKIYTTDPRTEQLYKLAEELGLLGKYAEYAQALEKELEEQKGKKLCLNVDGAIAALLLELGFDADLGKGFFIMSRVVGMVAHAHEQKKSGKSYHRLADEETSYTGPEDRHL